MHPAVSLYCRAPTECRPCFRHPVSSMIPTPACDAKWLPSASEAHGARLEVAVLFRGQGFRRGGSRSRPAAGAAGGPGPLPSVTDAPSRGEAERWVHGIQAPLCEAEPQVQPRLTLVRGARGLQGRGHGGAGVDARTATPDDNQTCQASLTPRCGMGRVPGSSRQTGRSSPIRGLRTGAEALNPLHPTMIVMA